MTMLVNSFWGAAYGEKSATAQAFPASTFNTSSASNVDLLNGSGGPTITVQLGVQSGDAVWIQAAMSGSLSNNTSMFVCVVSDGTTDYDVGEVNPAGIYRCASGQYMITGLAPGLYTFKMRTRLNNGGGAQLTFGIRAAAFLRATIVRTTNVKVINRPRAGTYNITAAANTDLLDQTGGNDYSVAITKALGATDLLCFGHATASNSGANASQINVASDGTTEVDMGLNRSFSASVRRPNVVGTNKLTGLSAGAKTIKMRVRSSTGTNAWQHATLSEIHSFAVAETGVGAINASVVRNTPASNITFIGSGFQDILDASGGSPVTFSFTKQGGTETDIAIFATFSATASSAVIVTLGVNDGTTNHSLGRAQFELVHNIVVGGKALTGLAAGVYTLTMIINANGITYGAGTNCVSAAAWEVLH
jgi:hypothetical protein